MILTFSCSFFYLLLLSFLNFSYHSKTHNLILDLTLSRHSQPLEWTERKYLANPIVFVEMIKKRVRRGLVVNGLSTGKDTKRTQSKAVTTKKPDIRKHYEYDDYNDEIGLDSNPKNKSETPKPGPVSPVPGTPIYKCRGNFFALYLVPNLLHLFAYLSILYLMRTPDCEKLEHLMERGFLETTRTTGWMMAHKRLVNSLRSILWLCLGWLILSLVTHGLIVYNRMVDDNLNMTWLKCSGPIKIVVVVFTVTSLTFNDLICGAIVTSYAVHCQLNISYILNLCASIREKRIDFTEFYKRIEESRKFIDYLNNDQALGLSLLQVTVGCKLSVGVYAFLASSEFNRWSAFTIAIVLLSLVFWLTLFTVPLIQGIRLTSACSDLRKIGHELRSRPFGYQETPQSDLDSLLLYTTNLDMNAKIIRVPVKASCILIICMIFLVVILMMGQLGLLNV